MSNAAMSKQLAEKPGFLAALDQSGGSTPGALRAYGIPDTAYNGDAEMFKLMHEMRVRIISSPAFTGDKVIAAILFERTMDGQAGGKPVPSYLWEDRGVVPMLKVDQGMEKEADGVTMMKPIAGLDDLLKRAAKQQYEVGAQISAHGLVPILEPEVLIKSPEKAKAEAILLEELLKGADALPAGQQVMVKVTIPDVPDLYAPLIAHKGIQRVVALSGGYTRDDACARLAKNHNMIASFSRALVDGLNVNMSDAEFNAALGKAIDEIYTASTVKS